MFDSFLRAEYGDIFYNYVVDNDGSLKSYLPLKYHEDISQLDCHNERLWRIMKIVGQRFGCR